MRAAAAVLAVSALALAAPARRVRRAVVETHLPGSLPTPGLSGPRARSPELRLTAYPGGQTLGAWRALPRGPLSVQVAPPVGASFVTSEPRREAGEAAPETCVPASYRWPNLSLRWERLTLDKEGPVLEEQTMVFDPARCRVVPGVVSAVRPVVVALAGEGAVLLAFRQGSGVVVLAPRSMRVVADRPSAVSYGAMTRATLSLDGARAMLAQTSGEGAVEVSAELADDGSLLVRREGP